MAALAAPPGVFDMNSYAGKSRNLRSTNEHRLNAAFYNSSSRSFLVAISLTVTNAQGLPASITNQGKSKMKKPKRKATASKYTAQNRPKSVTSSFCFQSFMGFEKSIRRALIKAPTPDSTRNNKWQQYPDPKGMHFPMNSDGRMVKNNLLKKKTTIA